MGAATSGVTGLHEFFIRTTTEKMEALLDRIRGDSSRLSMLGIGGRAGLVGKFLRIHNADIAGLDVSVQLLARA